jgi:Protein of unknown function (DUF2442)
MSKDLPNIERVAAGNGRTLRIKFRQCGWRTVRLNGFIARETFLSPLSKAEEFRKVKVIDWGGGVGWPGGIDLGASTLWRMAEEQTPFGTADFRAWQKRVGLSNQESADALGVSLPTIKNLRSGVSPVSTAVAIACRAMEADPATLAAHFYPRKTGHPKAA